MGWKGTARSINSTLKSIERESNRRQREQEKARIQRQKARELDDAAQALDEHEEYINTIKTLHHTAGIDEVDWVKMSKLAKPKKPKNLHAQTNFAKDKLNNYKPSIINKLLKNSDNKIAKLKLKVDEAIIKDDEKHHADLQEWKQNIIDWEESTLLAEKILEGDQSKKLQALKQINPFANIAYLGSSIKFCYKQNILHVDLDVHGDEVIPQQSYSLLKSGKLSEKNMPKGKFYELYQDFICSCILRVANEIFNILPDNAVLINAGDEILDTKTGHLKQQCILSVFIPRNTLKKLKLNHIDPSDSMSNFIHNMSFKKTKGFEPVEAVDTDRIEVER